VRLAGVLYKTRMETNDWRMSAENVKVFENYMAKAVEGDADAQLNLGWGYDKGLGVAQDDVQAVSWYRKAAEQGHVLAQFNLAICYAYGRGRGAATLQVAIELRREAVAWYRKAAEQGHIVAQFNLGNCYFNGEAVAMDCQQAVLWYRKAAEQGYAPAQFNLANSYRNGDGVAQDHVEAVEWYRKAAEQGDASAQNSLGVCYQYGQGVVENKIEAYAYVQLAAMSDGEYANKYSLNAARLRAELSADKITAGDERTRELQKEIEEKIAAKKAVK
jgi:TPR repeat protein